MSSELFGQLMAAIHLRNQYVKEVEERQLDLIRNCQHPRAIAHVWGSDGENHTDVFCTTCGLYDAGHSIANHLFHRVNYVSDPKRFDETKRQMEIPLMVATRELMVRIAAVSPAKSSVGTSSG
ncbi:MAG: hypothetical protein A2941_00130 [Candidatus Yanofskybacteria bacterium RIFCSPLOWO2_01_FULL_49_17]|uniref:Uncharacterized protein n=1 Tax=Candidatus Yanofskybacteria bacterium RIFCSPLOWO2_01_FULL_49_17 TaxID=1802700 RepID=A0A1F8GNX8_9BACT|nr:MAG: hypothetical protein A2941_00130 [Candidatus Yanofskybacteria bacterium RIFCSPLOWO2_01_FULL_49_17]